ncbi:MAG: hypothetical protein LBI53_00155 [Candidatus Peribacteria bacterium]|jgi:hypothetical protein|nr:hypothetical protein [Candidatus Peribacteria bacterium]
MEQEIINEPIQIFNISYSCDQEDITVGNYTIQACNLGSIIAGTGSDSYGYRFQRGNNYGFSGTVGTHFPMSTGTVDASAY